MIDIARLLLSGQTLSSMPPILIDERDTDYFINYNKTKNRLDRIAYNIYQDETYRTIIMFANPDYFCEYDIPDNTVIRVPFPLIDVIQEVSQKISLGKNRDDLQT